MDDYEYDDESCPKCGHYPTYARRCHVLGCDDGWIDRYDEDPLWYAEGDPEMCTTCYGTGVERWCPSCGFNLQKARLTQRAPDVCPVCNGKGSIRVGVYSENCEACNGTGKRR